MLKVVGLKHRIVVMTDTETGVTKEYPARKPKEFIESLKGTELEPLDVKRGEIREHKDDFGMLRGYIDLIYKDENGEEVTCEVSQSRTEKYSKAGIVRFI